MLRKYIIAFLAFMILIPGTSLFADAIRLSGGQVIEGTIIEEQEDLIIFKTEIGVLSLEKRDILEIEKEGGDHKIIRLPDPTEDASPLYAAAMSYIPGYSGLYLTKRAELGVPFTILNTYYFLKAVDYLSLRQKVDFFDSDYYNSRFRFGGNEPIYSLVNEVRYNSVGEGLFNGGTVWKQEHLIHYWIYQHSEMEYDTRLGGRIDKNQMSRYGNNYLRLWLAYSTLNAALSYALLQYKPSFIVDAGAGEEDSGTPVSVYAFAVPRPEMDGLNMGMMFAF